jgi:hypothetical protein
MTTEPIPPRTAVCQSCARVHPIGALIPDANYPPGLCPVCGGDTCDCEACLSSIQYLTMGAWDRSPLEPQVANRAVAWTADGGLVLRSQTLRAGTS